MATSNPSNLTDAFIEDVKDALASIYDVPALQQHPLAQSLPDDGTARESSAHRLRRELIEAIESLNPGNSVSVRSNPARLYNLMHLHYVGDMTLQETSMELGISLRQAYRDLRRGQESIANILWYNRRNIRPKPSDKSAPDTTIEATELSSIQSEITRLERDFRMTDLKGILQSAIKAVQRLATQQGIQLQIDLPETQVQVSTHQAIAQQILINLLSQTIQNARGDAIDIALRAIDDKARLHIYFEPEEIDAQLVAPIITQLLKQVGWMIEQEQEDDTTHLTIHLNNHGLRVLIVDDNEGLVDLLHHYISNNIYQVLTANNGSDGLRLAQEFQPDAIVMDLMMPGMDGWEVLQHLRTLSETKDIPVIICSVIHDPELAYSLGADVFIAKPVSKETIVNALKGLL